MTAVAPALAVAVAPALAALGPAGGVAAPPEWTRQPGGGRGSQRVLAGAGRRLVAGRGPEWALLAAAQALWPALRVTKAGATGGRGQTPPRRHLSLPLRKTSPTADGSWSQRRALWALSCEDE